MPSIKLLSNSFARDCSISKPLQTSVVGSKSKRGRLALTATITPDELITVAVLPDLSIVTRESRTAVVKSKASLGNTLSVTVIGYEPVII